MQLLGSALFVVVVLCSFQPERAGQWAAKAHQAYIAELAK